MCKFFLLIAFFVNILSSNISRPGTSADAYKISILDSDEKSTSCIELVDRRTNNQAPDKIPVISSTPWFVQERGTPWVVKKCVGLPKREKSNDGSIILRITTEKKAPLEMPLIDLSNLSNSEAFAAKRAIHFSAKRLDNILMRTIQLLNKSGEVIKEIKTGLFNIRSTKLCAELSPNGQIAAFKNVVCILYVRGMGKVGGDYNEMGQVTKDEVKYQTNHLYLYKSSSDTVIPVKSELFDEFLLQDFELTDTTLTCKWISKDKKSPIKKTEIFNLETMTSVIQEAPKEFNEQEYVKAYKKPQPLA